MDRDEASQSAIAKAARRLIPFLCLCYAVNFLDRVNVGFAALAMNEDLGFTPSIYGAGAGIFFVGYILFEIPSNLALQRFGARIWIARIMISWGLVASAMALVTARPASTSCVFCWAWRKRASSPASSSISPIGSRRAERARIVSLFMAAVPLATVVGGPLSGALLELHGLGGLKGWHWLFMIEGVPAVVLGVIALKFLDDRPEQANWLSRGGAPSAGRDAGGGGQGHARDRLCRARPGAHPAARAGAWAHLFLHRGRAVRHRLLDAASDPDLRARPARDRLPHRDPLSLRRHRHGAVGRALGPRRTSASACRAAAAAGRRRLRLVGLHRAALAHHGGAHARHARHLCRDRHVLVAADRDPDRHRRRGGPGAGQLDRQSRRAGRAVDRGGDQAGDRLVHRGVAVPGRRAPARGRDRAAVRPGGAARTLPQPLAPRAEDLR